MSKGKEKASWDVKSIKVFIDLCIDQVAKGTRKSTSFNKFGWKEISESFTAKTGRIYDKGQFKNKYDALRKDWQLWDRLLHETGVGWDSEKNTVVADDDWWDKKISEVSGYDKFRTKGLQFQEELTQLFASVAATGPHTWAPTSMSLPVPPSTEAIPEDAIPEFQMQEGSGDSDEVLGTPTGLSGEMHSFNVNESSGGSAPNNDKGKGVSGGERTSSGGRGGSSLGVRKRGAGMKKKGPASAKIADALYRIADANDVDAEAARVERIAAQARAERMAEEARVERIAAEARAERMAEEARAERMAAEARAERMAAEARAERMAAEARAYEISIPGVMNHLKYVPEVVNNDDFYARCVHLLMSNPSAREVYATMKDMPHQLLVFLKHECYGIELDMDNTLKIMANHRERRKQRVRKVAAYVGAYAQLYLCKEPRHTSDFTGAKWVREVLSGNSNRCYDMFRMQLHVFHELCGELQRLGLTETRNVGVHEMVAIFLNTVGFAASSRLQQERFQRSGETIHRALHLVLDACCRLAMTNIKPQDRNFENIHSKIRLSNRYWPFFKNAIGAIDGTHIPCKVRANERTKYIGRKGYTSQNVMAVCDWDMCFTFVLAGWEGTAHDARVFDHALTTPSMNFPHPPKDKYYLVDSGYPTPTGYLGPYRSERYHLPDFQRSSTFQNHNETFNYLHSSLRCTIERTFGVWKNKFEILQNMRSYSFPTQVKIVCATMAIHNFIRRTSISDPDFRRHDREGILCDVDADDDVEPSTQHSSIASSSDMASLRDSIRDQIVYYMHEA